MNRLESLRNWLFHRYPLENVFGGIRRHFSRPVPPHANILFTLGTSALLLFFVQAVTGLLLMFYYKPTVGDAHASVAFITESVPFGWLIRQLHVWGANLMVLVVFLHMVKTFVYGGYKAPREVTWMLGVVILGTVLGLAFTGDLLPWDELAFWATTVGTEAPASLPLVGPFIKQLMRGGIDMNEATLGRFFVTHVALLPIVLITLAALHLVLVRLQGTSPLTRTDEPEPEDRALLRAGGKPFFPNQLVLEVIVAYVLIGILVTLAILFPFHLGEPANPFETPPGIKPKWYFLPVFQLLKYLPEAVAVALPPALGLLILLLPFLDRSPERHPRRRPVVIGIGTVVIVATLALGILGKISETTVSLFGKTVQFDTLGRPKTVDAAPPP